MLCTFGKRISRNKRTNLLHIMIMTTATTINTTPRDPPTADMMRVTSLFSFSLIVCEIFII